jgi:acetyl-CoA carboxylase biotin carboxyl carrier protein
VNLDAEDVREILRLLDAVQVDELHLETERFELTLRRGADGGWVEQSLVLPAPDAQVARPRAEPERAAEGAAPTAPGATEATGVTEATDPREVRAPLLGTFYRAPKPGAAPFVEVGSRVEEDTVVGIVETMKLMNPVLAGVRGTVVEICVADGRFAEQGAVLLRVDPEVP